MASNFLYAIARSGKRVKIPLSGGQLNYGDIVQRLTSSGISIDQIPDVAFTLRKPCPPKPFTPEERAELFRARANLPPFPGPNENNRLPRFSETRKVAEAQLSSAPNGFSMLRDSGTWVDVMSLPKSSFENSRDYDLLQSSSARLVYAKIWRLIDQQNIPEGMKYERVSVFRSGMSESDTFETEVSLGFEGYGASASLRALFRREITVTREQSETETYTFEGRPGVLIVAGIWQECDIFFLEINGVRQEGFTLNLQTTGGNPYTVRDHFSGTLNPSPRSEVDITNIPIAK